MKHMRFGFDSGTILAAALKAVVVTKRLTVGSGLDV